MIQIDEIGRLYTPVVVDENGNETSAATVLPGWHVNATHRVADWSTKEVAPSTPRRVFAGVETFFYTFADEAEYLAASASADLSLPIPKTVPHEVQMRQARLALLGAGKLDAVETAIANMPGDAGKAARIEWQFSNTVKRHQPLVEALSGVLGLNSSQLDDLFIAANAL